MTLRFANRPWPQHNAKLERVMRATMLEYQSVFDGSGLVFDPYVESSAEEDAEVKTAEEVPQPAGSDVPHCTDSSDWHTNNVIT